MKSEVYRMDRRWETVVIGSGIGGLAAAAALSRAGRRVLVLERHSQPGGLTQTFERGGFRFNVGVHYLGGFDEGQPNRRLFDMLSSGRLQMARIAGAYDRIVFPDFNIAFEATVRRHRAALTTAFPAEADNIARYFTAVMQASDALGATFSARCMPPPVAYAMTYINKGRITRWVGRTTAEVIQEFVHDPRLRSVLAARWGDYGSHPSEGAFAMHATVTRHYLDGAWFPVGGAGEFARTLGATITAAGGQIQTEAEVSALRVSAQRVRGVQLASGTMIDCDRVISDIGIRNTLRLLPSDAIDYRWAADAYGLEPSVGFVGLYLGLEGDIKQLGADTANTWFYQNWDVGMPWRDPFDQPRAPALFVSFPSLRDPAHDPGPQQRHTCEIIALVDWSVFAQWDRSHEEGGMKPGMPTAARSEGYLAFKALLERNLLAQFAERFPRLVGCIRVVETSTPISVATYPGAEHGAMYGLQTTPRRFFSRALRPRTPIGGLYLAGQDAATPGVIGAAMGGMMAAASIKSGLWKWLR
jgi:phytoene dehydrogenase-like protein